MPQLKLSVAAQKEENPSFVNAEKISLNYRNIYAIDLLPSQFKNIRKLFLAHNTLASLDFIGQFEHLSHLSISHNRIFDIEELTKISVPRRLENLSVKGNFFDKHPDCKTLLLRYFPRLKELDNQPVTRQTHKALRDAKKLRNGLIPAVFRLQRMKDRLEVLMNKLQV